jgi:hypothetical protein
MPVTKEASAPYAPTSALMELIGRHRQKGLPFPITEDVLQRAGISGSLTSRTLQALITLDLIDEQGRPTPTLEGIRLAPEAEYQQRLADWLRAAYADALSFIDPAQDDETKIRDAFRSYKPVGQQHRMVTLFTGLFAAAGIRPERKRQPRATNRPPRSSQADNGSIPNIVTPPPSAPLKPSPPPPTNDQKGGGETGGTYHPFIEGLLKTLPKTGEKWALRDRAKWLKLAGNAFDLIYEGDMEGSITIKVIAATEESSAAA